MTKIGRNDRCPCGSGKKYKHCCQSKELAQTTSFHPATALVPQALQTAIQHHQSGRLPQAQALYQQILQADPSHPDALHLLGLIEHQQGLSDAAVAHIQQAIRLRPEDAIFHFNLANMQQDLGRLDEAIASYRQALLLQPDDVAVYIGLGTALRGQSRLDEAIACYRQALVRQPDCAEIHYNLANVLLAQNQLEQAVASYREALRLQPYNDGAYSNLLFTLQNLPTCTPAEVFREHQGYAERFEAPLKPHWQPHSNTRDPERRLKVGYVSGDLRQHAVAYFIEPILAHHDKSCVEVYAYYNHAHHDSLTERIMTYTDHWLDCRGLSDDQLAARIRADGIDILVDLSGHTALHRLLVFARKPAPVQVTWFGYIGSTGLTAMDYRLTNAFMDPPGLSERYHTEALIRLPGSGIAYRPEANSPDVNELPALRTGELMLGSLNTLSKINPAVIELWAKILDALPQARLMLGNVANAEAAQRLIGMFGEAGITLDRLILQPTLPMADFLALHQQIDLGLDPFPYNGGTTTLHALWMGVPVVTLAGHHSVARWGVAALSRVGLNEFICHSEDEYVQCAVRAAQDLPALNRVRQSLRQRMMAADCDPVTITRHLEAAYRDMWRQWCAQPAQ